MWQVLTTSPTIEASLKTLLEEFDVEEETLKKDLSQLISTLLERKMATII
jgi:DeoR/GlpR family transcriptional regulator of sugar metabolism